MALGAPAEGDPADRRTGVWLGLLSAFGIGLAEVRVVRQRTLNWPLGPDTDLAQAATELAEQARAALIAQGEAVADVQVKARIRYAGSDSGVDLPLAPPEVLDYVAAHEVAHLAEMNHSAAFWDGVTRIYGDYAQARGWLRKHGSTLHRYKF